MVSISFSLLSDNITVAEPIKKYPLAHVNLKRRAFSLPEKEEKNGSNVPGDEEFAFEETKGHHWHHEETYDQYYQKIPDQSVFDRGNHRATFVIIRKEKMGSGDILSYDTEKVRGYIRFALNEASYSMQDTKSDNAVQEKSYHLRKLENHKRYKAIRKGKII